MKDSTNSFLAPGSVIADRYEVIEKIGAGGVGAVLKVADLTLERDEIALKVLFPHMSSNETQVARFRNELLLARKISHPNVISLYDIGDAGDGYFFITMEYIKGGSLRERVDSKNKEFLTFPKIVSLLFEIALALDYAHSFGIIHRDLKPDNILLPSSGGVKVSDFGIARHEESDQGLTKTGESVGTPYYMSPEQFRGDKPDKRLDIYSLGIMAYQMSTGELPFVSEVIAHLAAQHLTQAPKSVRSINPNLPAWFDDFVNICLEKKPSDRYSSMAEVAEELYHEMKSMGVLDGNHNQSFCPAMKSDKKSNKFKIPFLK